MICININGVAATTVVIATGKENYSTNQNQVFSTTVVYVFQKCRKFFVLS